MIDETQITEDAIKSADQPRAIGRPFSAGNNANPFGRPTGSRNKATLVLDALAHGEANEILKKAVEAAKAGDMRAIDMILARVWPPRKSRPVNFALPPMVKAGDLVAGLQAVLDATASGELTPDEASIIGGLIEMKRKTIETAEIEERLTGLRQRRKRRESAVEPRPGCETDQDRAAAGRRGWRVELRGSVAHPSRHSAQPTRQC